ncbi:hypothetical protein OIV83_001020 [Microbotryomycetes sp. JL201]|nr:hypothetical protein OIV83_001020 [Microbotryomycetes sp. JL201]
MTRNRHASRNTVAVKITPAHPLLAQDILGRVPASVPVLVVDSVLAALTHPSAWKRRLALLVTLSLYAATLHAILSARTGTYSPSSRARASTPRRTRHQIALDSLDSEAAAYTPEQPSALQAANLARLTDLVNSRQSSYPSKLFGDKALAVGSSRVVGVTAVLLHWKRKKGLDLVISHLSSYPFIREIIVWNNRPGVNLKSSDFNVRPHPSGLLPKPKLRIFNSPSNVHDAGKHFACSLASYPHCYFNDDDWLNVHMDAQYSHYLECCAGKDKGRIVSNTMPIIHLEHRRWRFENQAVDMHTGFTWLGTGSFAPRQFSIRFLQQQGAAPVLLTRQQSMLSDMYFSLWTNTYPEQMPNNLVPIDVEGGEVGWSRGADVDQWAVVYGNILDAMRKLFDTLSLDHPDLSPDPFPAADPPPESDVRAPCANDGCLFTTSMSPFPPPSALTFPVKQQRSWLASLMFGRRKDRNDVATTRRLRHTSGNLLRRDIGPGFDPWDIQHIHEHEQKFRDVLPGEQMWDWPSDEWWTNNGSWHLAVDGKGQDTCWESWKNPDKDDYFGLSFVIPRFIRKIRIICSPDLAHIVSPAHAHRVGDHDGWQVFTSRDDTLKEWEPRQLVGTPLVKTKPLSNNLVQVEFTLEPILSTELHPANNYLNRRLREEFQDDGDAGDLEGDFMIDSNGDHVEEVGVEKLKFVSSGAERQRVKVCGFEFDGWEV